MTPTLHTGALKGTFLRSDKHAHACKHAHLMRVNMRISCAYWNAGSTASPARPTSRRPARWRWANPSGRPSSTSASAARLCNTKGHSCTYLAMGLADVRAGTQTYYDILSTRPNISESHSEISTRVPFCIAAGTMGTTTGRGTHTRPEGSRCRIGAS